MQAARSATGIRSALPEMAMWRSARFRASGLGYCIYGLGFRIGFDARSEVDMPQHKSSPEHQKPTHLHTRSPPICRRAEAPPDSRILKPFALEH